MKRFKFRKQNRLNNYDYSTSGYYYVTICTYNREYTFGYIIDNNMILNQCGEIAKNAWIDIPNHHKNIELGEFIIMPNHIHGIIVINNPCFAGRQANDNIFKWQKSFYDHIIRIDESLNNIRESLLFKLVSLRPCTMRGTGCDPAQYGAGEAILSSKDCFVTLFLAVTHY